jgi:hypothetical protein
MTTNYGPWATSMNADANAHLNAIWTRRLARQCFPRSTPRFLHQPRRTVLSELLLPGTEGVFRNADQGTEVPGRQPAPLPGVKNQQSLLRRQGQPDFIWLHQSPRLTHPAGPQPPPK